MMARGYPRTGAMRRIEKELGEIYQKLPAEAQKQLLAFAQFLQQQHGSDDHGELPPPQRIERPDNESVVAALKRLTTSYSMLDKSALLHESSGLMSQHVLQGRPAKEVIDELELLFAGHYNKLKTSRGESTT